MTSQTSATTRTATPGAVGFDCNTVLTTQTATAFRSAGFTFAIRYLSRNTPESAGDLSAPETAAILAAGLALMAVQHVQASGWTPSQSLGTQYGNAAVTNAKAAGLPAGTSVWLDLEGVSSAAIATVIESYCNAWSAAVSGGGYRPGIYVGANCGVTSSQIEALDFQYFWKSGSSVPALSNPGYCMVQQISSGYEVDGVAYDKDTVQAGVSPLPVWAVSTG